jgi:WD40 repeat protein
VISRDGSTAAWTEPSSIWDDGPQDVWTCRLGKDKLERISTGISARIWNLEISADGSKLATVGNESIGVWELPGGRLLGSIPQGPDGTLTRVAFLGPDRIRLYRIPSSGDAPWREALASIEVFDFEVPGKRLTRTSTIPNIRRPFSVAFDDSRARLVVWERGNSLSLFDAASGRLVAVLANANWEGASRAFLHDGRIAVGEISGGVARVHLYTRDGESERIFEAGPAGQLRLGGETAAGVLAIATAPDRFATGPDAYLLDLRTGALRLAGRHLVPVASRLRWRFPQPAPGSVASLLFSRSDGALVRLDPTTGTLKTILGR